jgi:1-acyl-sn-glycerol-3-phosphate acyltransferase
MVSTLRGGRSLLVFPEGTTSNADSLLPFRNGPFRAAAVSGTPVVPIALHGTRAMFPSESRWLCNIPIRVEILRPCGTTAGSREAIGDLRERVRSAIEQRLVSRTSSNDQRRKIVR